MVGILTQILIDNNKNRNGVIKDCINLIEMEISSKTGISGVMIKTGYKSFKAIKPNIMEKAVGFLINDFIGILDGHYALYLSNNTSENMENFNSWMINRAHLIADDMLTFTDKVIAQSDKIIIKKIYKGLRNIARRNVVEAIPGVVDILLKYADTHLRKN